MDPDPERLDPDPDTDSVNICSLGDRNVLMKWVRPPAGELLLLGGAKELGRQM